MNNTKFPTLIKTPDWEGYEGKDVDRFMKEWKPGMDARFRTWFNGQTGGITEDGKFCIYVYDFNRFCAQYGLLIGGGVSKE
jgi:hypothetical protein